MFGKPATGSTALRAFLLGSVALGLALPAQAADADIEALERQMRTLMQELEGLKAKQGRQDRQIEQQQRKIEAQEQQIEQQREQKEAQGEAQGEAGEAVAAPAQAVTGGTYPGSFKLPGTDSSIRIGGYVKADFIYDVQADTGDSFVASSIPESGTDDEKGSFRAHARQTRLNLTTWTPTDIGEIKTYIEGDFFGSGGNEVFSNSTSFRLRHAYGQLRLENSDFLFGQTWTLFMPLDSYPETIDFFGPAGVPFVRQGQARFTYEASDNVKVAFSVENSELTARDRAGNDIGSERGDINFGIDTLPDFIAAGEFRSGKWYAKLSGVGRLLDVDGRDTATGVEGDDTAFAWGLFAGAIIPTFGDDSFQLNATYGNGVGRYIVNGFQKDAFLKAADDLDPITSWGVVVSYTHHWSKTWRTNVMWGHYEVEDTFNAADTEDLNTAHLNLIWSPVERVNLGLEYIYGRHGRDDADRDNEANRIQFGAQFMF
jgi:hypothetical protein